MSLESALKRLAEATLSEDLSESSDISRSLQRLGTEFPAGTGGRGKSSFNLLI